MPTPEGQITGTQIWKLPEPAPQEVFIDEEPTDEEMAEDVAAFDAAVAEEKNDL